MTGLVTVVVPLRDEEATVGALLDSLAAQTRPPDAVVCVDAGSTDATAERIAAYRAPFPVRLLRRGPLLPGEARNEGVREARTEWIALTDAGIRLDPHWLERLLAAAAEADVVFGSYDPVCDSFFKECAALAYVPGLEPLGVRGPSVVSMLLRRRVFEATGGFPALRAAEDLVFFDRLHALAPRVAAAPGALAHWQIAGTFGATYRRFALYADHNLRAGKGRQWQGGLARQYALLAGALVVAAYLVGLAATALVPVWFLVRAAKAAVAKRGQLPVRTLRPTRIAGAALVLTVLDLATAVGTLRWLRARVREASRHRA